MKRMISILVAVLSFLTAAAQIQLKVTKNDGSVSTINDFFQMILNDTTKMININHEADLNVPMSKIRSIQAGRDNLPWNLSWKEESNDYHFMFGYGAIMIIRDVMTEDVTWKNPNYSHFTSWCRNVNQGKFYRYNHYVWGYLRDIMMEANQWISACKGQDNLKGLLGVAYASRALLYLDMARMYEFLPNDRTSPISASGQNVTRLTVPIITEETAIDAKTGYYDAPRATRKEMAEFILNDLDLAEKLIPQLGIESHLLPHLDAVYGLKARLYLWTGDYANAQRYARLAIETTNTKPMNREEMLSSIKGFNNPACWMWGVQYLPEDYAVRSGIINWTSWVSNQTLFGYTGPYTNMFLCIDKKMYDSISDSDVRKLLWIGPEGNPLNQQIPSIETRDNGLMNYYLPPYASVKFRPAQGNADDSETGASSAFPLMRVEEMYFIEAEAAAQQGEVQQAQQLINLFMMQYRDPSYIFQAPNKQAAIDEIIKQKRIELWGEGQTFFDMKRLNLSVTRDYDESNVPYDYRFNTEGRPAWMNFVFPNSEERFNASLSEKNNPDPSDVYRGYYEPLDEETIRNSIQDNPILNIPKFVDKIEVLPLDSVEQIRFIYTLPKNNGNVLFETHLQVSLSPNFPQEKTKSLSATTGDGTTGEINVWCSTLSNTLAWLLKQQGKPASGEPYIYLRIKSYVMSLPIIQYTSNTVSFRVYVSEKPGYKQGYSYAPILMANNVDVLDMERLAGQENIKVCTLEMTGKGNVYTTNTTDYPYRINLNLWDMGFNINENGIVDTYYMNEDPFISIYKINWGEYYTGHPAEYPGLQHYQADITCKAERDDLIFSLKSNTIDVSVLINRQAWEEYDYPWTNRRYVAMKSEMMPSLNHVSYEKAADADIYRLWAPYATGHNLMLFVDKDNNVTMPRQYAYNDTWGQVVYATGSGTFDGWIFDMNITFSNEDASQSINRHEVYGEKPEWELRYEGYFESGLFGEEIPGAIYQLSTDLSQCKLVPFIENEEGLEFTWNQNYNWISFQDQSTGYVHPSYGTIMASDVNGGYVDTDGPLPVFHFYIKYYVDAGSFGVYDDTFIVTNVATNRAKAKTAPTPLQDKKPKLKPQLPKLTK
jgi:hypothetical protein